ncbi:hypothetical protein CF319_g9183, partial [Tilletia indica]
MGDAADWAPGDDSYLMRDTCANFPEDPWTRLALGTDQAIKWAKVFNEAVEEVGIGADLRTTLEKAGVLSAAPSTGPRYGPGPSSTPHNPRPDPPFRVLKDDPTSLTPPKKFDIEDKDGNTQCMSCGSKNPKPSWRKWNKDPAFQVCHPCKMKYDKRVKKALELQASAGTAATKSVPKEDSEEGSEEGSEEENDKTPTPPPRPKPKPKKKQVSSTSRKVTPKKDPKPPPLPKRSTRSNKVLHPIPPYPSAILDPDDEDDNDGLVVTRREEDDDGERLGRGKRLLVPASEEDEDPTVIGGGGSEYWFGVEEGEQEGGQEGGQTGEGSYAVVTEPRGRGKGRATEKEKGRATEKEKGRATEKKKVKEKERVQVEEVDEEEDEEEEEEVLANVTPGRGTEVYGTPDDDDEDPLSSPSKKGSTLAKKVGGA